MNTTNVEFRTSEDDLHSIVLRINHDDVIYECEYIYKAGGYTLGFSDGSYFNVDGVDIPDKDVDGELYSYAKEVAYLLLLGEI